MKVSVVYPLLTAGIELKYSVRSLLLHGKNIGQIFIIGDKPKFFDAAKFVHIPFRDGKHTPYENVWRKLETIARDDRITETLLWMNDDFYIQQPFNAAEIPNYSRSMNLATLPVLNKPIEQLSSYKKVLKRTRDALVKRGMTAFHFGTHQPVNFEKEKMLATIAEFAPEIPSGISFRCCYHNMHASKRTIKATVVIKNVDRPPRKWAFASKATADLAVLETGLKRLYPKRSQLEV